MVTPRQLRQDVALVLRSTPLLDLALLHRTRGEEAARRVHRLLKRGGQLQPLADPLWQPTSHARLGEAAVDEQDSRVVADVPNRASNRLVDGLHAQVGVVLAPGALPRV